MPSDYAVYTTIVNKTHEVLNKNSTEEIHGDFYDFPDTIPADSTGSFTLAGRSGALYGCEGRFAFDIIKSAAVSPSKLSSYQTDPIAVGNEITVDTITPEALYTVSFRTKMSEDGPWTDGTVDPSGHPFWVEYTLDYQKKSYYFRLIHISAVTFHPIRNSRKDLIYGGHVLWDQSNPENWNDGTDGSFEPNLFQYNPDSTVPESSTLEVTVRPVSLELEGAEAMVVGWVGSDRVFQSEVFVLKVNTNQQVTTHVIRPNTSNVPFAWNKDVEWLLELRYSTGIVEPEPGSVNITALELYWISGMVHVAFKNEIPVGFLRDVLGQTPAGDSNVANAVAVVKSSTLDVTPNVWYQSATQEVFGEFSKKYDTVTGQAAFIDHWWGGNFSEALYRWAYENEAKGSMMPIVNCMDQAAMVELSCSLWTEFSHPKFTSWLVQAPFGYINTTHLVGITEQDSSGALINVNNPFFGTDRSYALLDVNDVHRLPFGCHVYVGQRTEFDRQNDGVYDACSGPHLGTQNAQDYVTAAIDTTTDLYNINNTHPGTVDSIQETRGVVTVNGNYPISSEAPDDPCGCGGNRDLLDKLAPVPSTPGTLTHVDWANFSTWFGTVLGDTWTIAYASGTASERIGDVVYIFTDSAKPTVPVRVHVYTESVPAADGTLDASASASAVRDRVLALISCTDRDPEDVWASGTFGDFGDYSLQYADNIASGRVVVVAANTLIDISGLASTSALEPIARSLLGYTVRENAPPLAFPVIEYQGDGDVVNVEGTYTAFSATFTVAGNVALAGVSCEDDGVLFDKAEITQVGEGGDSSVEFKLVTRELGEHLIHFHCADATTMICVTRVMQVVVA